MDERVSSSRHFLDTDRIRGIAYGNLSLRRSSHLFFAAGVVVSLMLFGGFWLASAILEHHSSSTGPDAFHTGGDGRVGELVTRLIELPPPPPLAPPPVSRPAIERKAVAQPAEIGKVKAVRDALVPREKTLATQDEISHAMGEGGSGGMHGGEGDGSDVPFLAVYDKMPGFIRQQIPQYPHRARAAGIEGKVFVSVLLDEEGRPMKARVVKRIPETCTVFDDVAIRSVMESKYFPGMHKGKSVKVWFTVPIRFQLN